MAKITKSVLKDVVKECLMEILSEGLGSTSTTGRKVRRQARVSHEDTYNSPPIAEGKARKASTSRQRRPTNPALDHTVFEQQGNAPRVPDQRAVSQTVNQITSDPIMSDILSDTANTTLQEQIMSEGPNRHHTQPGPELPVNNLSEVDIFAEGSKKWATLAFSDGPK